MTCTSRASGKTWLYFVLTSYFVSGRKRNRPVDEVIDLTCSPPINNVAKPDVYVDTSAGSPSKGKRQLECRICMGELKQPSATPCG